MFISRMDFFNLWSNFHGNIYYTVMKMDELYTWMNTTYVEQKKNTESFHSHKLQLTYIAYTERVGETNGLRSQNGLLLGRRDQLVMRGALWEVSLELTMSYCWAEWWLCSSLFNGYSVNYLIIHVFFCICAISTPPKERKKYLNGTYISSI